jgi:anthranilate synthase component 1
LKIKPSFSEFEQMAHKGNLIPVYQEFLADIETPVSAYLKLKDDSYAYLLESAEGGKRWGRYSFIGCMPYLRAISRDSTVEILEEGENKVLKDVRNPLDVMRDLCAKFKPVAVNDLPPYQGGFVGFFNYDLVRKWEHLPHISPADKKQPEAVFIACRYLIIFDHFTHMIKAVVLVHLKKNADLKTAYSLACREVAHITAKLQSPLSSVSKNGSLKLSDLEPNFSRADFEEVVRKAKDYIVAGEAIQVVLSQQFSAAVSGDDFALYRSLRSVNPSPYMFYLNFGDIKLIGASPEILVRLTDGKIELRPIAGTRPRGATPEEDQALEKDLMADPKERAEHIMLVDLGRNDVGKVAAPGSVTVPRLMEIERYSHVMHIVSRVEGILKSNADCFDLFMSAFPAGTVSGAPKIRAMEIISELEPCARESYAGAVGYFGFNGNMDFCITIRTITIMNNRLCIQVGAGIVADSSPAKEYEETLRKAGAMFKAIEKVKDNDCAH